LLQVLGDVIDCLDLVVAEPDLQPVVDVWEHYLQLLESLPRETLQHTEID
jgi:hypothetical protein